MTQLFEVLNAKGKSIATMHEDAAARRAEAIGGTYQPFNPPPQPVREVPAYGEVIESNGRFETVTNGFGGTTERRTERAPVRGSRSTNRNRAPGRAGSAKPAARASKPSITTLRDMLTERAGNEAAEAIRGTVNLAREQGTLTQAVVSGAIEGLKAIPRNSRAIARESEPRSNGRSGTTITEDGFYATDDGVVYKVQESEAGHLYAKELTPHVCGSSCKEKCQRQGTWEYQQGAVRKLRPEHKLDLERAKQFGALYGFCCVCGRTLRKESSIEAGIGPICAGNFGG